MIFKAKEDREIPYPSLGSVTQFLALTPSPLPVLIFDNSVILGDLILAVLAIPIHCGTI